MYVIELKCPNSFHVEDRHGEGGEVNDFLSFIFYLSFANSI